ncbi:MAG TPA: FAD-dependent oxidoreductase, partial [Candidatus Limnocylindrales bacterium]
MTDRFDVVVVGGGIVGLATAYRLVEARPGLRIAILEKEPELATHQTGHNSGVLHAGLYYPPGSLKARLCREGKAAVEAFAAAHDIPFERCGKLVVALEESELDRLTALRERALANGVPGLEEVGPERIRELEPHAAGIRGLWSPETGIVDFRRMALAMADDLRAQGVTILTGREVRGLDERGSE